ncbi:sulfurtransferase TusA family protein [Actinomadura bangladeshensis]|uniref:Sulfurtransferase TusA family protein n=1 Tax=Actinomadura bangladeshensis TaxID=453573 RepID=A0A6L9QAE1_9ACTN|nr:sulfurtransferase TusA family protein [Actinomadura bangladeshensis]NEA22076.1 sulfurtransferase TusA family protein [Actinomadura bangladeshensis]CNG09627.1 Sulfurtransferase TusA [Mycobacterium tuberculosis]
MRFRGRAKHGTPPADAPPPAEAAPAGPPPVLVIDALGRKCPIPIIMLAERIREVPVGQVVAVLADDAAARTDVPAWCRMKSQDFVREETLGQGGWGFHIRRTY